MYARIGFVLGLVAAVAPALAQPSTDFDWVTIGAVGNRGWDRGEVIPGTVVGRGSVGYEYRIGRTEVTTAQWMEYVNTFTARADAPAVIVEPLFWGASLDPTYSGPGVRYRLTPGRENAAMVPVDEISWRDAARFCNWLHNGKSSNLSALENGAYDTSTFGTDSEGRFTDQVSHHPGARFWIPTFDEWLKAAHYDPGLDRWWAYSDSSDTVPTPGIPGVGEANHGFTLPGFGEAYIPLGSYPNTVSPWGLLDAAGGTTEWTEGVFDVSATGTFSRRRLMGSANGSAIDASFGGRIGLLEPLQRETTIGVRIASTIPGAGTGVPLIWGVVVMAGRRRRGVIGHASRIA